MEIRSEIGEHAAEVLALEQEASAPYNGFVYADEAQSRRVRDLTFERGLAEFGDPHARIAIEGEGVVGMLAWLRGNVLKRTRLRAAMALAREPGFRGDAALQDRIRLASGTLLDVPDAAAYLSRIAVRASARGRGVGRALLERCEHEAPAAGCDRILLEVSPDRSPGAVRLYEARGFESIDEREARDAGTGRTLRYRHMSKALAASRPAGSPRP